MGSPLHYHVQPTCHVLPLNAQTHQPSPPGLGRCPHAALAEAEQAVPACSRRPACWAHATRPPQGSLALAHPPSCHGWPGCRSRPGAHPVTPGGCRPAHQRKLSLGCPSTTPPPGRCPSYQSCCGQKAGGCTPARRALLLRRQWAAVRWLPANCCCGQGLPPLLAVLELLPAELPGLHGQHPSTVAASGCREAHCCPAHLQCRDCHYQWAACADLPAAAAAAPAGPAVPPAVHPERAAAPLASSLACRQVVGGGLSAVSRLAPGSMPGRPPSAHRVWVWQGDAFAQVRRQHPHACHAPAAGWAPHRSSTHTAGTSSAAPTVANSRLRRLCVSSTSRAS